MANGWTNRLKYNILDVYFRGASIAGSGFGAFLATAAVAPGADTNLKTDLTEIALGNGYDDAGGLDVNQDSTDFDVLTEDDTNDRGLVQIKDLSWTAGGGPIPASGAGAHYLILTDRHATVTSREALVYWDFGVDVGISDGQILTLQNAEIRINHS